MEILGGYILFALTLWLAMVACPFVFIWVGFRIVRHLYHIEVALFQIRDAMRAKESAPVQEAQRRVVNSMFGR
jgi:hypothetical protein